MNIGKLGVRTFAAVLLLAGILCMPACSRWKLGPGCTVRVVNNTSAPMRNLEVAYPGGSFGLGSLGTGEVHVRWVQTRKESPCSFTVKHEDAAGKQYASKNFAFAENCPTEIAFTVDEQHQVEAQFLK